MLEDLTNQPLLIGFGTSLGLILAIGAQNAFVLRCGLRRQHVFWVCSLCAFSDALLIAIGVNGLGWLSTAVPWLEWVALPLGIVFLMTYSALRLRAFYVMKYQDIKTQDTLPSLSQTVLITLTFTWLNPHVYVDTIFLVGAVALPYKQAGQGLEFTLGAISASVLFFFSLGYASRWLAPLFETPQRWRFVELAIGLLMLLIAGHLGLLLYNKLS